MQKMKAARWYDKRDIRVEEVEVPVTGEKQIKIEVKYCGICGSDLHEYLGGPIFIPVASPHPYTGEKAPVTMGHEFCGQVVEVGSQITKFKIGDRVTVEPIFAKNVLFPQGIAVLADKDALYAYEKRMQQAQEVKAKKSDGYKAVFDKIASDNGLTFTMTANEK